MITRVPGRELVDTAIVHRGDFDVSVRPSSRRGLSRTFAAYAEKGYPRMTDRSATFLKRSLLNPLADLRTGRNRCMVRAVDVLSAAFTQQRTRIGFDGLGAQ
jgi:hypothetical protein